MEVIANKSTEQVTGPLTEDVARDAERTRAIGPDALRALAILLVIMWHLPYEAIPTALHRLQNLGWLGVDLFFVLSGFLIGGQLLSSVAKGQAPRLRDFYLRRGLRILPPFLVVLALYALVPTLRESPEIQPVWRYLTFSMNFGLDVTAAGAFTHAWSLCVEEHFYLLLPPLVLLLWRADSRIVVLSTVATILIGGMILRWILWDTAVSPLLSGKSGLDVARAYLMTIYYPTYCRLDGLLMGVLLAATRIYYPRVWQRYANPRLLLVLAVVTLTLALAIFHFPSSPFVRGPVLSSLGAVLGYPLFSAGCALLLAASLHWGASAASSRLSAITALAVLSYSIYLSHKMVIHVDQLLLGEERMSGLVGLMIYAVTILGAGTLLWYCVERPSIKLRDLIIR